MQTFVLQNYLYEFAYKFSRRIHTKDLFNRIITYAI